MGRHAIKVRVLIPAALALMGLLGTFVFGIYRLQRNFVEDEFLFRLEASEEFFQGELADYSKKLGATIDTLSQDRQLCTMWRNGERQALLDYTSPLFDDLRSKYGITHFYFHNKDRVNFLRVHYPQRHGDLIERFTLRQAAETGRPHNGIELGPLGTFALRAVYPCRIDGELLGYLELAQEIESITQRLHDIGGVDVILLVEKEYLDRKSWEAGMKMLRRNADWNRLDNVVVIDHTFQSSPDEILDSIQRDCLDTGCSAIELSLPEALYLHGKVPLHDAGGRQVARMVIAQDVTARYASLRRMAATLASICLGVAAVLLAAAWLYLGRIEQRLEASSRKALSESHAREAAQARHIEEIRRERETLRESEERFRSITTSAKDAIIMMDPRGCVSFWNEAATNVFGYTKDEAIGRDAHELIAPRRYWDDYRRAFSEFRQTGRGRALDETVQVEGLRKDGSEFPVEISLAPVNLKGQWHAIAILRDVSERKRTEEILRKQTEELSNRVRELNCLYAISKLLEKPDIFLEEIVRETLAVVPPGWQYPEITSARVVLDGKVFQTDNFRETAWKLAAGVMVDNELVGALEVCYLEQRQDEDEGPFLKEERALIDDIVERLGLVIGRRRAEQAAWEQAAALEQFNRALEEANSAAQTATRAKSEFLANMSHEIRTPMTAILGFADALLSAELSPSERQHAVQTISRNGKHLLHVINDVLDLSKVEAGKLAIELIDCSPLRILAEVESLMRVRIKAKGLNFELQTVGPVPKSIRSDPTRLRQILLNLAGNAVKFTEIGGIRLVARLIEDGARPMLQYEVIDTGMGMTADVIEKIFQPFTQADETVTRRFGGTGLGLTICRRLAEALEGEIAVESEPGCGSTFRVTVPTGPLDGVKMVDQPSEATVLALAADLDLDVAAETEVSKIRLHGRILLAEDGPDNQRLISLVLRKAGVEVVTVENGLLACERVAEATQAGDRIDLVLMDMQMPVMDGYTATGKLRADGFTGPIIALTAHTMPEDREKCLAAGCDDYATKPIQREQLLALLGKYLPETAAATR